MLSLTKIVRQLFNIWYNSNIQKVRWEAMSREKSLFKNTIILAIGTFLPRVLNVATSPILTTYLTTEESGSIDFITTMILTFIVPIFSLQLEQAFFRFLIDAKTEKDKKTIITSGFGLLALIMLVLGVVAFFIPVPGFGGVYKYLLILYLWIEIIAQMSRFILRAFSMYKQYSVLAALTVIVNLVVLVLCIIVLKTDYRGMFIALLAADIVGILYVFSSSPLLSYISLKNYDSGTLKEMVKYSLPFIPNMVAWSANLSADKFLITSFLGVGANGIYTAAYRIPSIVSMLYPAFNLAWTESASRVVGEKDSSQYYSKMYKTIFCILSAGTAVLLSISPYLFRILVRGKGYMSAIHYVPVLIMATYMYCFAQFFSSIYIAIKESKNMSISTTIAAVVNILINLILIRFIGIWSAAICSLLSNFLLAAYRYRDINKNYYKMHVSNRITILTIVVLILQMVLFWQYNLILNIVNIVISLVYAYFMCGDIVMPLIKSLFKRSK